MQVEEFRDYIRNIPISQVISRYIPLNKKGQNHEAICPFHDDSNPSLKVNDSKGIYKCFVCGESGDGIKFVQNYRNKNFIESLKELSEIFNINLEIKDRKNANPKYKLARRILDAADNIFYTYPRKTNHPEFQKFLNTRGLSKENAEKFRIGFISDQNILSKFLEQRQADNPKQRIVDLALEIGIIKKGHNGLYDTFRNRITFPIWDQSSRVVGFGSRSITEKQMPKYLNSGDSLIFNKSMLLYGVNIAKNSIHDSGNIILTEGYMDTVSLHQFDFHQSVAIMGIALSDMKAKHISSLTKNVFLSLDNDKAGFIASKRVNDTLMKQKIIARKIDLTPCKDPDDFLKEKGRIAYLERMENARPFIDELIEIETSKNFGANTDLKIDALNKIFELLSTLGDDLRAHERIIKASQTLGLSSDPENIVKNYQEFLSKQKNGTQMLVKQAPRVTPPELLEKAVESNTDDINKRDESPSFAPCKIDTWILQSLFQFPAIYTESGFTEILDFVKNIETKNFVLDWESLEIKELAEDSLSKILFKIFDKENSYSKPFENFVYSMTFSFAKTDTSKVSQQISELKKKVTMESLIQEKKSLKEKRLQVLKEEDLNTLDNKIMTINKEISNLKIQNQKF